MGGFFVLASKENKANACGMTNEEALKVLDQATQPEAAGKISRFGYVQINAAIIQLDAAINELAGYKTPVANVPKE